MDFEFDFHSKVPVEFADTFSVDNPSETKSFFKVTHNLILQEFEDGTALCVERDNEYIRFHSNKQFNQTISSDSEKIIISFPISE